MQSRLLGLCVATSALFFTGGCETPWYAAEPVADALIPPTNACTLDACRQDLADKVGKPADINFFGDQAVYMGDYDSYRYVHVRDIFDFWGFLGECDLRIADSEWPMEHPMPLTSDATKWVDVTWMNKSDGPEGVWQNPFLHITPTFRLGAPKTQPALMPTTTIDFATRPAPDISTTKPLVQSSTAPTTRPSSQP